MFYHLVLLLPCAICLFGSVWLLCKIRNNTKAQNILALCFLLSSIFFFCTANYVAGVSDYITYMKFDIVNNFITLLVIPTMYLYFRLLTNEKPFTWVDYIWFSPAFIVGIGTCVLYLAMDETDVANYIKTVLIEHSSESRYEGAIFRIYHLISVDCYNLTALILILGAGICAVVNLRRYHQRLREFYSDLDSKSMDTDNKMLLWSMLAIPLALGIIISKRSYWECYPILASLYFIVWAVVYFGMLYYGSKNGYTVENLVKDLIQADLEMIRNDCDLLQEESVDDEKKNRQEMVRAKEYTDLLALFNKLIDEDRMFLQSDIRASEVSNLMKTNRTCFSQMIKEEYHCTFSDYINRKRIEYSKQLMRENPTIKSVDLAGQSGFGNVSSFGRMFKQITGLPPKEWLKKDTAFR